MVTTMRRARVVYWNNIPSPYVVERFNALAERGNLDFEAWFNEEREPDRSWDVAEEEWRFSARYIPKRTFLHQTLHLPLPELRSTRPDLLVSLYASASFATGIACARALGIRTALRVLPTFDAWVGRSRAKEAAKQVLFRVVEGVKVPGPDGAAMARRYGLPAERIVPVTQSINLDHYAGARTIPDAIRRSERARLRLTGCTFICVGRLWSGKGLDYLFDAFDAVRSVYHDATLLLVGDGVDEARYRERAQGIPGVVFAGFVQARDLPRYYGLADVSVFPTLGDPHGLVVEESMAAGLPVITTEAAGDIRRRLPDGQAGFIVAPAESRQLAARMITLAGEPAMRRAMGEVGAGLVMGRGHKAWARDFESFVERMQSLPRRQTFPGWSAAVAARAVMALSASYDVAPCVDSSDRRLAI